MKRYAKSQAIKELEQLAFDEVVRKHPNFPYPVRPKYNDNSTNGLTKCVIDYIRLKGFHAERINSTGSMRDNRKTVIDVIGRSCTVGSAKWIRGTTQPGTADLSATINGRSVKIEVKCSATGDKIQSKHQKAYQEQIEAAGGVYLIVRTFEEFFNWYLINEDR